MLRDKIKQINNALDISKIGYKINKVIFWLAFVMVIIPVIFLAKQYGFHYSSYLDCKDGFCDNPFYGRCDWKVCCKEEWCLMEQVPKGVYGQPTPDIFKHYSTYILIVYLIAFLINHFAYNRKFKVRLDVEN